MASNILKSFITHRGQQPERIIIVYGVWLVTRNQISFRLGSTI